MPHLCSVLYNAIPYNDVESIHLAGLTLHVLMRVAGPMDKETAIKVLRQARQQAEAAVATAARYAAAAGLNWQAPAGFRAEPELPRVREPLRPIRFTSQVPVAPMDSESGSEQTIRGCLL